MPPLVIPSDTVIMHFRTSSTVPEWGWRATFTADAPFMARQNSSAPPAAVTTTDASGDASDAPVPRVVTPPTIGVRLTDEDCEAAAKIVRELQMESPPLKNGGGKIASLRKMMKTALPRMTGSWRSVVKYTRPSASKRVHSEAHKTIQGTITEEDLFLRRSFGLLCVLGIG